MDSPIYHLEGVVKAKTEDMEDFVGPLDLILHLLSKNKMEIKDIQISLILDQYLAWMAARKEMDLEVASEFVTMASQLVGREPVGQLVEGDAEQAGHRTDQQQKQLKPVHMLQKTIQRPHGGLPSLSMGHPWTNKYLFIIPDSQRKYKTANQAALFQKMLRRENFGNLQKAGG